MVVVESGVVGSYDWIVFRDPLQFARVLDSSGHH
jgi:hypothetical protein